MCDSSFREEDVLSAVDMALAVGAVDLPAFSDAVVATETVGSVDGDGIADVVDVTPLGSCSMTTGFAIGSYMYDGAIEASGELSIEGSHLNTMNVVKRSLLSKRHSTFVRPCG